MGFGSRAGDVRALTACAPGVRPLRLRGVRRGCAAPLQPHVPLQAAKVSPEGPGVGTDTSELNKAIIKHCQCLTALLNNCFTQQQCFNLALISLNNALIICTLS